MYSGTIPAQPGKLRRQTANHKECRDKGPKFVPKTKKFFPEPALNGAPEPPDAVRDPSGTYPSEDTAKSRFPDSKKNLGS